MPLTRKGDRNPTALLIGENVHDNAALDSQFLASVREHVVLQPITAIRADVGMEVRDGQRCTLAAREAKLDTIPVYVLDACCCWPVSRRPRSPRFSGLGQSELAIELCECGWCPPIALSSERLATQHLVIFRWAAERCGAGSPRMVLTEWSINTLSDSPPCAATREVGVTCTWMHPARRLHYVTVT